jgi:hypothetical protein
MPATRTFPGNAQRCLPDCVRSDAWQRSPKPRACLMISPPETHDHLRTVLVAPMTTMGRPVPFRIAITLKRRQRGDHPRPDSCGGQGASGQERGLSGRWTAVGHTVYGAGNHCGIGNRQSTMSQPGDRFVSKTDNQQATFLDLVDESFGPSGKAVIRLALSVLAFGVTFYVIHRLVG